MGELVAHIRADTRGFRTGLLNARRELEGMRGLLGKVAKGTLGFGMAAVKATVGAAGLAAAVGAGAVAVVGLASAVAGAIPIVLSFGAALLQAGGAAALIPGALAAVGAVVGVVKLGMVGLGDAMKAVASGDVEKLNEALERLAPNARAFVKQVNTIKPAFDKMRLGVQNRLFAQTAGLLKTLAAATLPTLTVGANRLAEALNKGVVAALADLNTKANQSTLASVFGAATTMVGNLAATLRPVGQALLDIVGVGAQITAQLSQGAGVALAAFAERLSEMAASGELKTMILDGLSAMKDLWSVGRNLLGVLGGLGKAIGLDTGGGLFAFLDRLNEVVNSAAGQTALGQIFDELGKLGTALTPVLLAVLQALVPVAKGIGAIAGNPKVIAGLVALAGSLGDALANLVPGFVALAPLIGTLADGLMPLSDILVGLVTGAAGGADTFLRGLVDALKALAPAAPAVGRALGAILAALGPLLPVLGEGLADILVALSPLIVEWMNALTPAIPTLIELVRLGALVVAWLLDSGVAMHFAQSSAALLMYTLTLVMGTIRFLGAAVDFVIRLFRGAPAAVDGFGRAAQNAIGTVLTTMRELPGRIMSALGDLGNLLVGAGQSLVTGLWRGIQSMGGWLRDQLVGWARTNIPGPIMKALGIGSPSKVMAEQVGKWIPLGIVAGIRSQLPALQAQMAGLGGLAPNLAPAGTSRTTTVNVTVQDGALAWLKDFVTVEIDDHDTQTAAVVTGGSRL